MILYELRVFFFFSIKRTGVKYYNMTDARLWRFDYFTVFGRTVEFVRIRAYEILSVL